MGSTVLWYYIGTPWPITRPVSLSTDLYHQLGWAASAEWQLPPTNASVVGVQQGYHWFTYIHLAAAHQISGVSLPWILFRLYLIPPLLIYALAIASAAARLARRPWAGPFAAAITPLASELFLGAGRVYWTYGAFRLSGFYSPTWVYSLVYLAPLLLVIPDQIEDPGTGRRRAARWAVIGLLMAGASGAKSSLLPVLFAGLVAALAYTAVFARHRLRTTAVATGWMLAVLLAAQALIYGSGTGRIELLPKIPYFITEYYLFLRLELLRHAIAPKGGAGTLLNVTATVLGLIAMLAGYLAMFALWRRRERRVAQAMLLGAFLGGYIATRELHDPAFSESWFLLTGTVPLSILAGWGTAVLLERLPRRVAALLYAFAASAGFAATLWLVWKITRYIRAIPVPRGVFLALLSLAGLFVVLVAAAGLLAPRLAARRRPAAALTAVAVLFGAALASTPLQLVQPIRSWRLTGQAILPDNVSVRTQPDVTPALVDALLWLKDHSRRQDVIAVNNHCLIHTPRGCLDRRVFYYTAFSQRRAMLESWSYSDASLEYALRHKVSFLRTPSPFPRRTALNDAVFTDPTAAELATMWTRYGVRWLVVDLRYGGPPPGLERLTVPAYRTADAAIFRLRPPG